MLRKWPITIGITLGFAASAMAADLPKEGAFKGTYTEVGTSKTIKIGDRALGIFDETGVQMTDGFGDHMAFHCWGTAEIAEGQTSNQGYCVATDPRGDLIEVKFATEKHPSGQPAKGTATYVAGTGKYAGIIGGIDYTTEAGSAFKSITEGAYVGVITINGHYKLP